MSDGSIRELSRRVGVSDTAINKARADGRLPADLFGTRTSGRPYVLDLDEAERVARSVLALESNRGKRINGPKHSNAAQAAKGEPAGERIDPTTGVPPRNVSDARRAHWDALKAQALAEEAMGLQLPREEVTRSAFAVAREVRDSLLLIEDRLADQLAAITDPGEVRLRLREEFRNALAKLSSQVATGASHADS